MQRIFISIILLSISSISFAHSVYIFAWVDGSQICTESYFTKTNKVRGGEALMQNMAGDTLSQKTTGEDGIACFALPNKAQKLNFIILAGAGHRGQFTLEENELVNAVEENDISNTPASKATQNVRLPPQTKITETSQVLNSTAEYEQSSVTGISEAQLRVILHQELQKQLSPLRQYVAEKFEDKTPELKEIIGGIGWLMGLGAMGYWLSQRRKKGQ